MKRIISALLAAVALITISSLSSCGSGEILTGVYSSEQIALPDGFAADTVIRAADGSLSCLGTNVQLTRCEVSSGLSAVWNRLDKQIAACLDAIPLSTLATADAADEYVI